MGSDDLERVVEVAKRICEAEGVLCVSEEDWKLVRFGLATIETYFFLEDSAPDCVKDYECSTKILSTLGEVFTLIEKGVYAYNVDIDKYVKTLRRFRRVSRKIYLKKIKKVLFRMKLALERLLTSLFSL